MSIVQLCVCFILGYIFGNIPNGYLYAKSQGVDIYHQGSGNPGSTNVLRTLGKRAGITVLLMDIAKCMVPIFLMILFWKPANEDQKTLILMLTGIGAILGHNFPILPGVKGGKGVACTGALLIALAPLYPGTFMLFYPDCFNNEICQLRLCSFRFCLLFIRASYGKIGNSFSVFGSYLSAHVRIKSFFGLTLFVSA